VAGVESPDAAESAMCSCKLAGQLCGREEQNLIGRRTLASKQARKQASKQADIGVFLLRLHQVLVSGEYVNIMEYLVTKCMDVTLNGINLETVFYYLQVVY
jgi:hypothetical protein